MSKVIFHSLEELRSRLGSEVAISPWLDISQSMIQAFADSTKDHQWIHIDSIRAKKESPYRTTIAHGFLTLSLVPYFLESCMEFPLAKSSINYGLNKVRFPHAVNSGSRIRGRFFIQEIAEIEGGIQVEWKISLEVEGVEKPACVAEMLIRLYF
jgi:acyl dehydratase